MNRLLALALAAVPLAAPPARAAFMDVNSVGPSAFGGTLDGVTVEGTTQFDPDLRFRISGPAVNDSTLNGTSPQYSYEGVYTPSAPLADRVGYTFTNTGRTPSVGITFGAPVTNPVFHVANLDGMQYHFLLASGLTGLTLLSSNGGGGDGLQVVGITIRDADPLTAVELDPATPPPASGPRSAYGSVQLNGTFTTLRFFVSSASGGGDGGSFTFSSAPAPAVDPTPTPAPAPVPEPATLAVFGCLAAAAVGVRRRRG